MKKRKDGLYASQVYLGTENGKRKYKTVYGKTQKEVKEKVAELKLRLGKGIDISASEEPFSLWAERFIKGKEAEGVGYSHLSNLRAFNGHLGPIHDRPLSKITATDIQSIIDTLTLYHEGKKPLSKRTLTGVKQFAGQVFKMAIGARVVEYNPADYAKVPKTASETRRTAITEEQQRWVRETPHRAQRAAMIMLYAGLRRGEVTALTWADINLDGNTINVSRAAELSRGRAKIKGTKTSAGVRVVPIPALLADFLRNESDGCLYVVHDSVGGMMSKTVWRNTWKSYMKDLNVKYGYRGQENKIKPGGLAIIIETFTPHQLRHTFASLLYMAGVDALTAKEIMGHKDIRTTLGIYTHLDKKHKQSGVDKLDEYLCKYDASNEVEIKA